MSAKQFGTIGIVGICGFVLAYVALHFLNPDSSVIDAPLSDYALGDYGWLNGAANLSAAVGLIAIALGLRLTLAPGKRVTASWVLIFMTGAGFIVSGLFATDGLEATEATAEGIIHIIASMVSMLSSIVAVWMLRGVFSRDSGYRYLSRTQHWFAVLITIAFVGSMALGEVAGGLAQRVFAVVIVAWWFVLAGSVRRSDMSRPGSEQIAHA